MDIEEARRWYFLLISDSRGRMREEARARIAAEGGAEYAALARAGSLIGDVVFGIGGAHELQLAQKELGILPISSVWNGFMEATGQTLVAAAKSMEGRSPTEREAMLEHGLHMLARAQDGGLPLSRFSIEQIRPIAEKDGRLGPIADSIMKQNRLLMPEVRETPRRPKPEMKKEPGPKGMKRAN